MKKNWLVMGASMILLLGACDQGNDNATESTDSMDLSSEDEEMAGDVETEEGVTNVEQTEPLIGEKVIKSVNVEYETTEFQDSIEYITNIVESYDAYVEYSNEWADSVNQHSRRIDYSLRVPTESLDAFLDELEEMDAYKVSEMIGTEDITQTYRDTEARINVLNNKEERLNALLEEAESIEAIIQIEDSLSETIAERESLQSIIDSYDSLIDYTMVHLSLTERTSIANNRGEGRPFLERVQEAFMNSAYAFFYFLQNVFIWIIYAIPFILVIGLIAWIVYIIKKRKQDK